MTSARASFKRPASGQSQSVSVATCLVETLGQAHCPVVLGMPGGGSNLDVVDAAHAAGLPFRLTATETGGVIAAAVAGDVAGGVGAALATLGPGVASAVNGLAAARLDRLPVVFLSDRYDAATLPYARRQLLDHAALVAPVTKGSWRIDAGNAAEAAAAAVATALRAPRGPVHLDLDAATARARAEPREEHSSPQEAERADEAALAAAVGAVERARRPLVVTGLGVRADRAARAVRRIAEELEAPLLTTLAAKGVVPDEHPLAAGVLVDGVVERELLDKADLVLALGLDAVEFLPWRWPYGAHTVLVDETGEAASGFTPLCTVVGPLEQTLAALANALADTSRRRGDAGWAGSGASYRRGVTARLARALGEGTGAGLAPHRVVALARSRAGDDAIATVDSGAHMFPAAYFWPVSAPRRYLCSSGLATMSYAIPAAIGASLAAPSGGSVVALVGDAGFVMSLPELATLRQVGAPVVVVVFVDESLSLIKLKQDVRGLAGSDLAVGPISCRRLAEGFGLDGYDVATEREYEAALEHAFSSARPTVIGVRADPGGYPAASRLLRG